MVELNASSCPDPHPRMGVSQTQIRDTTGSLFQKHPILVEALACSSKKGIPEGPIEMYRYGSFQTRDPNIDPGVKGSGVMFFIINYRNPQKVTLSRG